MKARRWVAVAFVWLLAPLVDRWHGLSLTRFLAIYFALLCGHTIEQTHSVSINVLWLALATIATAFGKSTFTFLLARMEHKASVSEVTVHTIQERRGNLDFEPSA